MRDCSVPMHRMRRSVTRVRYRLLAIGYAAKRLQPRYNRPQRPSLAFADFDLGAGGIIHD